MNFCRKCGKWMIDCRCATDEHSESGSLTGSAATKFQKDRERWRKKYGCSLGKDAWCDGADAKRCPNVLITGDLRDACELGL